MPESRASRKTVVFGLCLALCKHGQSFSPMPITTTTTPTATRSATTQLSFASVERSCIELIDPETGCEVVLVGCFHGSPSSAKDVEREVQTAQTDVVALELCAARFSGLRKTMALKKEESDNKDNVNNDPETPRVFRFVQVVGDTIQRRGLSTGVATGILGGVSGLQTALSGFTPGLEFTTAVESAQNQQREDCDIILADQSVDETVEKVGQLPRVVRSMWKEIQSTSNIADNLDDTQWGKMAIALRIALAGDPEVGSNYQVKVGSVVTRNQAVVMEMARLMVPPVVITQLALTLINRALFPEAMNTIAENGWEAWWVSTIWDPLLHFDPLAAMADATPHVLILSVVLFTAYAFLAVPVTQVILSERDDQLTRGIQAACRIASVKQTKNGNGGRVVAILGLLHVNGVAKRLLQSQDVEVVVEKAVLEKEIGRV